VVAALFEAVGPCTAYFGEKDFQQLVVVSTMVRDLGMPIEVVGCPTIREEDGLALSSRNVRLSPAGRVAASILSVALQEGANAVGGGESVGGVLDAMTACVATEPAASLFYAAVVDPMTLETPDALLAGSVVRLLLAAEVDGVRLIDNRAALVGPTP
jgi:pantoate--beta-alanine ligase